MTTYTILSGKRDGLVIAPAQTVTWGDLGSSPFGSWSNWTSWKVQDSNPTIQLQIDDDLGSLGFRTPLLNYGYEGDASVVLKISDSGSFTGEETTYNFVLETPISYVAGRYYRWLITVTTNSTVTEPYLDYYITNYTSDLLEEVLNDVDVFASPTTTLSSNLGLIRNIQATALQGDPYVVDGYVESTSTARTATTLSNNGVTLLANNSAFNKFSGLPSLNFGVGTDNYCFELVDKDIMDWSTGDHTIEGWFYSTTATNETILYQNDAIYGDSGEANINMGIDSSGQAFFGYNIESGSPGALVGSSTIPSNTWVHIAVVKSGTDISLYVDGTREDTETFQGWNLTSSEIWLGALEFVENPDDSTPDTTFSWTGFWSNFRISNVARYSGISFTPSTIPFASDSDTTLLLSDGLTDDVGYDSGGTAYFVTQSGGSPVIKQKNPPQVVVVDYQGSPWDGTIDAVLRGYPKIQLTVAGVEIASFRGDT